MNPDLPPPNPWLVLHPGSNREYPHFHYAADHPFIANATSVVRRNACWLADAALLAYYDEAFARDRYDKAGLRSEFFDRDGLQAQLAYSDEFVIVAFRGTQPDQWEDIIVDATFDLVSHDGGTRVHKGFKKFLFGTREKGEPSVWSEMSERLTELAGSRSVWFCGHSLGAALAVLAAYAFPSTRGVCTFGCPRVGDTAFAKAFNRRLDGRSLRYVNDADVVTHVPPSLPNRYDHVDAIRYIAPGGAITTAEPEVPHFFLSVFGEAATLLEIIHQLLAGTLKRAPHSFLDHMPEAYAVHIWKDYVAHL